MRAYIINAKIVAATAIGSRTAFPTEVSMREGPCVAEVLDGPWFRPGVGRVPVPPRCQSATGEASSALRVDWSVVQLEVVAEGRLIRLRELIPMHVNVGRTLYLSLRHNDRELVWANLNATERHEGQMAPNDALFDCCELRDIGFDIDIHVLEFADLLPKAVDDCLAVPFGGTPLGPVLILRHGSLPDVAQHSLHHLETVNGVIPQVGSVHSLG
jgi:hypothetical protein